MRVLKGKAFICVMALGILSGLLSVWGQGSAENLMPVPCHVQAGVGKYRIDDTFQVKFEGDVSARMSAGVSRMVSRLGGRTGFFLPQTFFSTADKVDVPDLIIETSQSARIELGMDESYVLNVDEEGIRLTANTDVGALRGLETFLQLLDTDEKGYFVPAVYIRDEPRFPWRGLMIDVSRHFQPIAVIKRNLDGMAAAKMNVLHLHLTDNQGFRVECKTYPKLHELGSEGGYFTQAEIKEIVRYASDRGIRVIPEFDLPGHATSWFIGYPELASTQQEYSLQQAYGIFDPTLNVTLEETYVFLDAFFKEMSALFPDSFIHIGGDENSGRHWLANEQILAFMKANDLKDQHELQSYFNGRLLKILGKYNKQMIGWDEILQPGMPGNIVIQSWRGQESMVEAAKKGYRTILSNGYYIDLTQTTEFHYLNDPLPADVDLEPAQREMILGGEATMWAEIIDKQTIDSRIWPRTAAIAERFWSPASVRDVDDMYRRIKIFSFQLEELGLTHLKNASYLLRRLSRGAPIDALATLVDIIEPVKGYRRNEIRMHYTYSQMSRLVDVAIPDAEKARNFRKMVKAYLEGGAEDEKLGAKILSDLEQWKFNHAQLEPIIKASPILWEIESLSADASACGKIGVEAMDYIKNGSKVSEDWAIQSWSTLYKARRPRGQAELMIVSAIEELMDYAAPGLSKNKGDNTLSGKEIAEGWTLLFDGETMEGWKVSGKKGRSRIWEAQDGCIHCKGSKEGRIEQGEDLLRLEQNTYFEFSADWKVSSKGSTGIFYLCHEVEDQPLSSSNLKMQLGAVGPVDGQGDKSYSNGSVWGLIPASSNNASVEGEWNRARIIVRDNGQILHIQNNETLVDYWPGESWFAEWEKIVEKSSFKGLTNIEKPQRRGQIGLQDQGSEVWFKNVKIRKLY